MTVIVSAIFSKSLVICEDNKIIGCGAIGPYWDKTDESCFFTIFVLPEYQGKGHAGALMKAMEGKAKLNGMKKVHLDTDIINNKAIAFYSKSCPIHIRGDL